MRLLAALALACAPEPGPAASAGFADSAADTAAPVTPLQLAFPLEDRAAFEMVIGFDHDPVVQEATAVGRLTCTDFQGRAFPHCYDEHHGTDFILKGGFDAMDAGSATIHAAAPGVVVETEDGHYDRCHASLETGDVDCDGHERIANAVVVQHAGGFRTLYWHLMTGSVVVAVGQQVEVGDVLGKVGSSGWSSMPHLHLSLEDAAGDRIDPYAGPYSQPESWWCAQAAADGLPGACD